MIKPWDYINEYKKIKSKIIKSIDSSLSTGFLILGPQLDLFEKNESYLLGHPVINKNKGIEFSTGRGGRPPS